MAPRIPVIQIEKTATFFRMAASFDGVDFRPNRHDVAAGWRLLRLVG
jgi:hypothetical protein